MVSQVINSINEGLKGITTKELVLGSAQKVMRYKDERADWFPGIFDQNGEAKPIVVDDRYHLIIYHRLGTSSTVRAPRTGVGDSQGDLVNTYSVNLFAYWDMRRLIMLQDEMQMLLQARIPGTFKIDKDPAVRSIAINWGGTLFNNDQIYQTEYNTAKFSIPLFFSMLMMTYTVTITFDPDCYKRCP